MNNLLTILFGAILVMSFRKEVHTINSNPKSITIAQIDTSVIAIIPSDSSLDWVNYLFNYKCKSAELNTNDLSNIASLLTDCIKQYNKSQEKKINKIKRENPKNKYDKNNFIIDLKRYKRQYIAVANEKGEKEVWINCFCNDSHNSNINWKKEILMVKGGGNCYFNVKVNLMTKNYYDFKTNNDE